MKCLVVALFLLILTGCSEGFKRNLGLVREAPDEFMVVSQPDLILPPNFNLVEPDSPIDQYNYTVVPAEYNSINTNFNSSERNFLNHLGLKTVDNKIRIELNKHKSYKDFTEEKSIISKTKEIIKREDEEENVKHVIIPVEEKKRLEENIKNHKSLTEGEIPTEKQEKTLWDKITGK